MDKDIRWKQRFQNFERAFLFLKRGTELGTYDDLQKAGLVRSFDSTFELAWKTLKDYLFAQGLEIQFPREIIKHSFATRLIEDGTHWIQMLDKRNELTHTYNQEQAERAIQTIRNNYYPLLEQVYNTFKKLCLD